MIIHTIHQPHQGLQDDPRVAFIKIIRSQRPKINIAVTVSSEEEHQLVKELGPDYILNPFRADAKEFVEANW